MNIIEAAQAMRDGKRVRLPWWGKGEYACQDEDTFTVNDENGDELLLTTVQAMSTDWEVAP
jgi:hypothetical protein